MPINAECNPTDACITYICSDGYELNSATTTIRLAFKFEKNKKMGITWFENHKSDVCIDINECDRGTHNCDLTVGICQNLVGTFVCNCPISHYMQLSNTTGINECNLINCKPGFTNLGNVFHINPCHGFHGSKERFHIFGISFRSGSKRKRTVWTPLDL